MIMGQMRFSFQWSSVSSSRLMKRSSAVVINCSSRNYCLEVARPQRVALSQSCGLWVLLDSHVLPPLMEGPDSQCSRERTHRNSWSVGHRWWRSASSSDSARLKHVETFRSAPLLFVPRTSSLVHQKRHYIVPLLHSLDSELLSPTLSNVHTQLGGCLSERQVSSAGVQLS